MIGPVGDYRDIYVAACGCELVSYKLGIEHERECDLCIAAIARDLADPDVKIRICCDGVWAGDGIVLYGQVENCSAVLGGSQKNSDAIYEAIAVALEVGESELEWGGRRYSWEISREGA